MNLAVLGSTRDVGVEIGDPQAVENEAETTHAQKTTYLGFQKANLDETKSALTT